MNTFYITPEEFWSRFNSEEIEHQTVPTVKRAKLRAPEIRAATCDSVGGSGRRYIIMYGRHKPGKKSKTWEADGYLSLIGQMAYVSDLRGRLLEEPTLLDDEDFKAVEDLSEILIGNTEVQVIEEDRKA